MKTICATKDGKAYVGNYIEVAETIARPRFDGNQLYCRFLGFCTERKLHGYTEQWTSEEMYKDACEHLLRLAVRDFGYQVFIKKMR